VVLALLMARSPMPWGRSALSIFSVAALFLVKRMGELVGVDGPESLLVRWTAWIEPRRLESGEELSGD
jgi:hypothetical protein